MIRNARSSSKTIFGFAGLLAGFVLLIAFALFLNALFASRASQTVNQPPPSYTNNTWKIYDDELFTVAYPPEWFAWGKETVGYKDWQRHCFAPSPAPTPGKLPSLKEIVICVDINPRVKFTSADGTTSRTISADGKQDLYTNYLRRREDEVWQDGSFQVRKVRDLRVSGMSAVEVVKTLAPGVESEPSYSVLVYFLSGDRLFSVGARSWPPDAALENDSIFREMVSSFTLKP